MPVSEQPPDDDGRGLATNAARLTCCVVGDSDYTVRSAELIRQSGLDIAVVVSASRYVGTWAERQGIPTYPSFEQLREIHDPTGFDFLFSIIHDVILPADVLGIARRASVNFHNSPLPRYAGVNAASWAVLNDEHEFGVTWHLMAERTDTGSILVQRRFSIEDHVTAYELNQTCFRLGLDALAELIEQLVSGDLHPLTQDLSERSYFRASKKAPSGGLISWEMSAVEIDRLVRAHDLGTMVNTFGLATADLGSAVAVVRKLHVLATASTSPPGTIVAVRGDGLQVATSTDDVLVRSLVDVFGIELTPAELSDHGIAATGTVLASPTDQHRQQLAACLTEIARHERFCVAALSGASGARVTESPLFAQLSRDCAEFDISHTTLAAIADGDPDDDAVVVATVLHAASVATTGRTSVLVNRRAAAPLFAGLDRHVQFGLPISARRRSEAATDEAVAQLAADLADELFEQRLRGNYARHLPLQYGFHAQTTLWAVSSSASELHSTAVPATWQVAVQIDGSTGRLHLCSFSGRMWPGTDPVDLAAAGAGIVRLLDAGATAVAARQP